MDLEVWLKALQEQERGLEVEQALEALRAQPDLRALPVLCRHLLNSDFALARRAHATIVAILERLLQERRDESLGLIIFGEMSFRPPVRYKQAHAILQQPLRNLLRQLPQMPDEYTLDRLCLILSLGDEEVRREAIALVSELEDERVVEVLCQALQDPEATVRQRAVEALAEVGDGRAVEPLEVLLRPWRQEPPALREAVWEALARIEERLAPFTGRELAPVPSPPPETPTGRELSEIPPPGLYLTGRELAEPEDEAGSSYPASKRSRGK
ncbi:MAG TPA: HEAT repeat domain-containing protein [Armatimonadetes bacterium]|nr:HEAT repeat domain-containing protein [Armatimonadota bacterium]